MKTLRRTPPIEDFRNLQMPFPAFARPSPRPDGSPWLSDVHTRVRSFLQGSSVYSDSPVASTQSTPKIPFLGFLRRPNSPPDLPIHNASNTELPRESTSSHSPLQTQHTAGSYQRAMAVRPEEDYQPPATPRPTHTRYGSVDPETEHLAEIMNGRGPRNTRGRQRPRRHTHWIRRRKERSVTPTNKHLRGKCLASVISGLFLAAILSICA